MLDLRRVSRLAALAAILIAPALQAAAPADDAAGALLKSIAGYRFGQDRSGLLAVEKLTLGLTDPAVRAAMAGRLAAMLDGEATPDCKRFVCNQLSLIGTAAEVPALAKRLTDDDLSFAARFALERIPGDDSLAALRGALTTAKGKTKIGILDSLAARGDVKAIEAIAQTTLDPDRETVGAAIKALGTIGGPDAAQALLKAEGRLPAAFRAATSSALLRCAQEFQAKGQTPAALDLFDKLGATDRPATVRTAALLGRLAVSDQQSDDLLLAALRGEDMVQRAAALRALRGTLSNAALVKLTTRLADLPPECQTVVLALLADRRDPATLPAVARAAADKSPAVRRAALAALAALGDASTVAMLTALIDNGDKDERKILGDTLARLRGPGVDEALVAVLDKSTPMVRCEIVRVAVARDARTSVPALLRLAAGQDARPRQEALRGLARLADADQGPAIMDLLDKAPERALVETALVAVYRDTKSPDAVFAAASKATGPRKASLMRVLGSLGGIQALASVRTALASGDADVRREAIQAMAGWADDAPLDDLVVVATTTRDASLKLAALRGIGQLAPLAKHRGLDAVVAILARAITAADGPEGIKPLLSALGKVATVRGGKLAARYLNDPALRDEAAMAILQSVESLAPAHRAELIDEVRRIRAACDNPVIHAAALAIPTSENLALGGTATNPDGLAADGVAGGPQAAIDGNPATYWDEIDNQKLYQLRVQLKKPALVGIIRIVGFKQHQFAPRDFEILCDGKSIKLVRNAQYENNLFTVDLPPTECGTVELKITGYYGGSPAIRELEIYAPQK